MHWRHSVISAYPDIKVTALAIIVITILIVVIILHLLAVAGIVTMLITMRALLH